MAERPPVVPVPKAIAKQFEEEVAAFNYLRRRSQHVPDVISPEGMRVRYLAGAMEVREDGHRRPREIVFQDGTVAVRDSSDMFMWREVKVNGYDN